MGAEAESASVGSGFAPDDESGGPGALRGHWLPVLQQDQPALGGGMGSARSLREPSNRAFDTCARGVAAARVGCLTALPQVSSLWCGGSCVYVEGSPSEYREGEWLSEAARQ
ncbi:hypothetical protein TREES_T100020647 [Tupaia chinensis]|uniref:Uncharacterized protein n=1 Tax=Tupaia chinensis TaxID=246437 RepID=L9KM61_TUPCH|nr:hypothetical protein TREES_T100020647 [Tupaia chinensis]